MDGRVVIRGWMSGCGWTGEEWFYLVESSRNPSGKESLLGNGSWSRASALPLPALWSQASFLSVTSHSYSGNRSCCT